jgi:hypothetical protein
MAADELVHGVRRLADMFGELLLVDPVQRQEHVPQEFAGMHGWTNGWLCQPALLAPPIRPLHDDHPETTGSLPILEHDQADSDRGLRGSGGLPTMIAATLCVSRSRKRCR